jgi:hypothetical protein
MQDNSSIAAAKRRESDVKGDDMTLPATATRGGHMSRSFFVAGGCPRSGTNMLFFLLNTNPSLRMLIDTDFERLLKAAEGLYYKEQELRNLPERAKGRKEQWTLDAFTHCVPQRAQSHRRVIETLCAAQFEVTGDITRVRWFGDKLAAYYSRDLDYIQAALGEMRFVHITRNPFDVITSLLRRSRNAQEGKDYWTTAPSTTDAASALWKDAWSFIRRYERDPRFLHIRYEDLIFRTSAVLKRIAAFFEVDNVFDDSHVIRRYHFERECIGERDIAAICRLIPEAEPYEEYCRREFALEMMPQKEMPL